MPQPTDHHYCVYGVRVGADRPIDGLAPTSDDGAVDLRIRFDASPLRHLETSKHPCYVSPFRDRSGRPAAVGWDVGNGAYLRLVLRGGMAFLIGSDGAEIWVDAPGAPAAKIAASLVGPILGMALRHRGTVCLHASAVDVGETAIAFVGSERSGKSTMAALFALRGYAAVTDDLVALVDRGNAILIEPGPSYLRVRPGVIEAAAGRLGRRDHLKPALDAYFDLDLHGPDYRVASRSIRLGAIYVLDARSERPDQRSGIEAMTGAGALMSLVGETWAARLLDRAARAKELDLLARLVQQIPVRRLHTRGDLPDALALVDRVIDDYGRVSAAVPAASGASRA